MSIQYNRHFGTAISIEERRSDCFYPLSAEGKFRYHALMLEPIQGLEILKQDLIEFLHSTLSSYGFYEMYIVGGSAQQILIPTTNRGDFDLAIFSSSIGFQNFLDHLLPFLGHLGLTERDFRINQKHRLISFNDIDIKFPDLEVRTHLFDADAFSILLAQTPFASLIPGAQFERTLDRLNYVIDCNRNKMLVLTNPEKAQGFGFRAFLKITQGWSFDPILFDQAYASCLQNDTLELFERSLRLFILGHAQSEKELFLLNLHSILQKRGGGFDYLNVLEAIIHDEIGPVQVMREGESNFLSALRVGAPFVEEQGYFRLERNNVFIPQSFSEMSASILKEGAIAAPQFFECIRDWVMATNPKESLLREKILKNLVRDLISPDCLSFKGLVEDYFFKKRDAEALTLFKKSTLEHQVASILKKGGATEDEFRIVLKPLVSKLEQFSVEDLAAIYKIFCKISGKDPFEGKLLDSLLAREDSLKSLIENVEKIFPGQSIDILINAIFKNKGWVDRLKRHFVQDRDEDPLTISFWYHALQNKEVYPCLDIDLKKTFWFDLDTYLDHLQNRPLPSSHRVLFELHEEHVLKVLSDLKLERLAKKDKQFESVFQHLFEKSPFDDSKKDLTTFGGLVQKMKELTLFADSDLCRLKNGCRSLPKEAVFYVQSLLNQKVFATPERTLAFFLSGAKGILDDVRYFEFLKRQYPLGISAGYMGHAFLQDLEIIGAVANEDYLKFLRGEFSQNANPAVRKKVFQRLVALETFDADFDEEVFVAAFKIGRLSDRQIFNHFSILKKHGALNEGPLDLFQPLFLSQIWTNLPEDCAISLAFSTPTVGQKDLEKRVEFLTELGQKGLITGLLLKAKDSDHFIDEKKLVELKPLFFSLKDWVSCFNWKSLIAHKKELDPHVALNLFFCMEDLSDGQLKSLGKIFAKLISTLSKEGVEPLLVFLKRSEEESALTEKIALSLIQNTNIIQKMDPRLYQYFERMIPKIKSRKFLYEPIRIQLIKQRPKGNFLEFIGSKELIDLIKFEPSLANPLVMDRISEGRLQVKMVADLIKQNQCSKEILIALIGHAESNKLTATVKKELYILGLKNQVDVSLFEKDPNFALEVTWDDYKANRDCYEVLFQHHPQIHEIYLKLIIAAFDRKDFDQDVFPTLCMLLPSTPIERHHARILSSKLKQTHTLPKSFLLLLFRLGFQFEDHLITLEALSSLIAVPNFEAVISPRFWQIQPIISPVARSVVLKDLENLETHVIQAHYLRSFSWAVEQAKEGGMETSGVTSAREIIKFFWKKDFLMGENWLQITEYIDLFPQDSIERTFVDLLEHIRFFTDKGTNISSVDLEKKGALDDLLQDFARKNQAECRLEMVFKVLENYQKLMGVAYNTDLSQLPFVREINNFGLMKLGCIKFLSLQTMNALEKLSKQDYALAQSLSIKFLDHLEMIIIQTLPGLQNVGSHSASIKHLLEMPSLPLSEASKNIVYLQILLHLSYRFYKDPKQEEADAIPLRNLLPLLKKYLIEAASRAEFDKKSYAELRFILMNLPEYIQSIKPEEFKLFIELGLLFIDAAIKDDLENFRTEMIDSLTIMKETVSKLIPTYGFDDGGITQRKWIRLLTKIAPYDSEIKAFEEMLAPNSVEHLLLESIDSPSFERVFLENILSTSIQDRAVVLMSFMQKFTSRLSFDEELFELQKYQSNIRVLQTIGRKIQSEEFMDLLGAKNPENKSLEKRIYESYFQIIFKNEQSMEISQGCSTIIFDLNVLMDRYLLLVESSVDSTQLLDTVLLPYVRCYKIALNPKKSLVAPYLSEEQIAQAVIHWVKKLEAFFANFEKKTYGLNLKQIGLVQKEKIRTLSKTELKIDQIRDILSNFYNWEKAKLLEKASRIQAGRQLEPMLMKELEDLAYLVVDCFRYLGQCGKKFRPEDLKDLQLIKRVFGAR